MGEFFMEGDVTLNHVFTYHFSKPRFEVTFFSMQIVQSSRYGPHFVLASGWGGDSSLATSSYVIGIKYHMLFTMDWISCHHPYDLA